ncbi:helix-turn-helix domain-containing protein [Lactobacillus delbrueckii]|uniref:helix-turn-helix domain-containing protein n=1 Tax=Lactobacillus delbrueckii TaxID=1584 RepID=UPI0023E3F04B|nr:helix-turn-helix domain-containing protein [Lactobacillus delbrueckii]MDF4030600.1 helix-turn-helix domain-containing protein [Lactobacillus delbrueckii]
MDQDVLTRKQAMDTLNVKDYRTLNKLIEAGLPVIQAGSYVRFSKRDISEFLEKHKERGGEASCK